ncbi:HAD family hydrolase [Microbacterium marinilacus]|uniref:HAD family hydrolase n=1 Tax=Microbacterium marinilacus TaxID=415209 RepID=A0ABP7BNG6_9MICO|nr:HAD-IA family hydrolase [Microbacterium marinilacus]MBY0689830.1 HAD family hydrolase [Microbacterium marinilacus]
MSEPEPAGARVVLWDFDGTLARRDGLWAGAMLDAAARAGVGSSLRAELLRPQLVSGFPWHTPEAPWGPLPASEWWGRMRLVLQAAYARAGLTEPDAAHAAEFVALEYYRPDAWAVLDGAREALAITQEAGYRNVVLGNHPPELGGLVTALGLAPLIELVVTSADAGADKPNRLIFEHALRVADAGDDVWMIGDNPIADVAGAEAAGIRALLADGAYADAVGLTVRDAARHVADETG